MWEKLYIVHRISYIEKSRRANIGKRYPKFDVRYSSKGLAMEKSKSFKDLKIWQKGIEIVKDIYLNSMSVLRNSKYEIRSTGGL